MNRIVIIGSTGTGKSTLAQRLSEKMALPVVELDELHWLPGWISRAPEEFRRLSDAEAQKDKWIIVGNYSRLRDVIWSRTEAVVWLDYSFSRTFRQLLSRSVRRIVDKCKICNGNVETWEKLFSKGSVMLWFFENFWRCRRDFGVIFDNPQNWPHIRFIRLRSPEAAQNWLESLS